MKSPSNIKVKVWQLPGILLEEYKYTIGSVEPLPKHSHHEYQLGISFNCQGEYYYRGSYHPIPIGNLSIIHSGEVHSPSERTYLAEPATFWMMHVEPNILETTAREINEQKTNLPFFIEPILSDRFLRQLFCNLCLAVKNKAAILETESVSLEFFSRLVTQQNSFDLKDYSSNKPAIKKICDYLQANYTDNVSLAELANIVGMSRFYLSRLFHREKGLSLNAYLTQIRIDRAKKLLSQGTAISTVAVATGFYDQSHFSDRFKRLVGTTPGNYQKEQ